MNNEAQLACNIAQKIHQWILQVFWSNSPMNSQNDIELFPFAHEGAIVHGGIEMIWIQLIVLANQRKLSLNVPPNSCDGKWPVCVSCILGSNV
jgi:hypothetical protein